MKIRIIYLIVTFVIGCFLFGCDSSSNQDRKQISKSHTIEIKQMKFVPENITVNVGDKITFVNKDLFTHDVTEQVNRKWSSNTLNPNSSWTMIVKESSDYFCSLHVVMKGKIRANP